jgi:hypothetical protein
MNKLKKKAKWENWFTIKSFVLEQYKTKKKKKKSALFERYSSKNLQNLKLGNIIYCFINRLVYR